MRGVTSSEGRRDFPFSELVRRLEWIPEKNVSQALDAMVDTGLITATVSNAGFDKTSRLDRRSYRIGEIVTRVYRAGEPRNISPYFGVDAHLSQFKDFLKQVMEDNYDYIVPIERKGGRLLQHFFSSNRIMQKRLVPSEVLCHVAIPNLKGKRVLLFDDTVATGQTLAQVAKALQLQDTQVSTCALYVHEECPNENIPNSYYKKLTDQEFAAESAKIALDLTSFSDSFEPGRLVLKIRINDFDINQFVAWLETKGTVYQTTFVSRFSDRKAFSLSDPVFFSATEAFLPNFVSQETTSKIRMYIKKNEVTCIPIVFPEVHMETVDQVSACKGIKEWSLPFCKNLPLQWYEGHQGLQCAECSAFHASSYLVKMFLKHLHLDLPRHQMNVGSWRIDQVQLYYYFRDDLLVKDIMRDFRKAIPSP